MRDIVLGSLARLTSEIYPVVANQADCRAQKKWHRKRGQIPVVIGVISSPRTIIISFPTFLAHWCSINAPCGVFHSFSCLQDFQCFCHQGLEKRYSSNQALPPLLLRLSP